jgi:hypothetical protein
MVKEIAKECVEKEMEIKRYGDVFTKLSVHKPSNLSAHLKQNTRFWRSAL